MKAFSTSLATMLVLVVPQQMQAAVDYPQAVKPLLKERCYACHGTLKQKGGLRLDTVESMRKGGDSGPAILAGKADQSPLIERLLTKDPDEKMPPKHEGEPFTGDQVRLLQDWIAAGAKAPVDETPEKDPREHWAFRERKRPQVPRVSAKLASWVRNPIDAFVAERLEKAGLTPQPEASAEVLLRRLSIDLLGVPPTAEEVASVSQAGDSSWVEPTVERMLQDPRYGERWARHWMDIWRYSDAWILQGHTVARDSQKHLWHWRDWIIESLNSDLPYSEMVQQMLAADELYPDDLSKLRATGFLARNFNIFTRLVWLDNTVEHVSKGFLGLTFNCAKCHDHKYDPIHQEDYYRLRSFFEPYHVRLDVLPGQANLDTDGIPRVFDAEPKKPTYLFVRGDESRPDKSRVIEPGVPEVLAFEKLAIREVPLPLTESEPARRPWVLDAHLEAAQQKVRSAQESLDKIREKQSPRSPVPAGNTDFAAPAPEATALEDTATPEVQVAESHLAATQAECLSVERRAEAMRLQWQSHEQATEQAQIASKAEREAKMARARHKLADLQWNLAKAKPDQKAPIEKKVNAAMDEIAKAEKAAAAPGDKFEPLVGAQWSATQFGKVYVNDAPPGFPSHSTGRRSALARWLTDSRNPLTPRVAANHIWMRHMGKPLVSTVFEFGRKGAIPTHLELLDWLASELVEGSPAGAPWAMKSLHRLIVTSATYRMTSSKLGAEAAEKADPDNRLLWRRNPVRIEAEAVRDCILAAAGTLDKTIGGPSVPADKRDQSTRRSMYFTQNWVDRSLWLATFDGPDSTVCYQRDQSIVPQQALALSNAAMVQDAAKTITERLAREAATEQSDSLFIDQAFLLILNRAPDTFERTQCMEALQNFRRMNPPKPTPAPLADPSRIQIVAALLNHNDLVTLR